MTRPHNPALPPAGVGVSSAPVWEVYPFKLALLCSADRFHWKRARIRMKAGFTALDLVADAMAEGELWNAHTPEETAQKARRIADALRIPEQDRKFIGI